VTSLPVNYQRSADDRAPLEPPTILEALWRFKPLVVASMLVFAVLAYFYVTQDSGLWTATTRVALVDPAKGGSIDNLNRYSSQQAVFARSDIVLDRAAKAVGEPLSTLRAHASVHSPIDGSFLIVNATAKSASLAKKRSSAVAQAFEDASGELTATHNAEQKAAINAAQQKALNAIRDGSATAKTSDLTASAASSALTQLYLREADLDTEAARFGSGVDYIEPARAASKQSNKQAAVGVGIGALFGLFASGLLAWAWADRLRRADDSFDPGVILGAPLLGEVPDLAGTPQREALLDLGAMPALSYEFVAASLGGTFPTGVLLVTGAERGAGASVTTLNLAAAAAREGRRVVVVDADNTSKSLSTVTGTVGARAGISDVVAGRASLADAMAIVSIGSASLSVIPAGSDESDITSLYRNRRMEEVLTRLRADNDLVIIDCPPLVTNPEAASLSRFSNGILAVVRSATKIRLLERLDQRLDVLSAPLVGYVFTRSRTEVPTTRPPSSALVRSVVE